MSHLQRSRTSDPDAARHGEAGFWRTWVFSTDHKTIAKQYLAWGLFWTVVGGFLSAVVAHINRRYPRIAFEVTQRASIAQMLRDLRERQFDLIIGRVMPGRKEDDFVTEVLFEEPWSVVAGPQNPLARRRKVTLPDLLNEPWTLPPSDSVVGSYLTEAFRAAGLDHPRTVVTTPSIQMHHALMVNGPFLAIFPRSILRFGAGHMALKVLPVELPGRPPPVGITTLKSRTLNPVTQLFIACAHDLARPLTGIGLHG